MVGVACAWLAGVGRVFSKVVVLHNGIQHQVETIQDDCGSAQHLNAQDDAPIPEIWAQVQRLCDTDLR